MATIAPALNLPPLALNQYGGSTAGVNVIKSGTPNAGIAQNSPIPAPVTVAKPQVTQGNPVQTQTTDPAAAAAAAARAKAAADYGSQKTSALNSITDLIGTNAGDLSNAVQQYLYTRGQSQNSINNDAVQNELARQQGMQGVLDMVGNGIKSGGVILANNNAGDSSASEAIARAYGTLGRQQASSVGNQAAQGQNKIDTEEDNLLTADAAEAANLKNSKADTINNIVNNARTQLANLNYYAASASIPDRVDIEGQIAQVKQQAMDALSAYDATLANGASSQARSTAPQVRQQAQQLLTAGVAPADSFNFTSSVPAQFQDTGQFASSLPIFTSNKKSNQ